VPNLIFQTLLLLVQLIESGFRTTGSVHDNAMIVMNAEDAEDAEGKGKASGGERMAAECDEWRTNGDEWQRITKGGDDRGQ